MVAVATEICLKEKPPHSRGVHPALDRARAAARDERTRAGAGDLYIANGIDGPGFNLPGGVRGPDLAINGAENFTLSFTAPAIETKTAMTTAHTSLDFMD